METPILEAKHINKTFQEGTKFSVLKDICFSIKKGEFVSIMGKSGCGKSTLLYILSTMDTDYNGELWLNGELLTGKNANYLAQVRNEKIGFVFQFHYLLNEFTVLNNVMLPGLKMNRFTEKEIAEKAMKWLNVLEIGHLQGKKPYMLSGGEKQRVAIARALINDPLIIMGDEPTGNLDKGNTQKVLDIFKNISKEFNQTLLIVTHDISFAECTNRIIEMEDGKIKSKTAGV